MEIAKCIHKFREVNDGRYAIDGRFIPYLICPFCGKEHFYDETQDANSYQDYMAQRTLLLRLGALKRYLEQFEDKSS